MPQMPKDTMRTDIRKIRIQRAMPLEKVVRIEVSIDGQGSNERTGRLVAGPTKGRAS